MKKIFCKFLEKLLSFPEIYFGHAGTTQSLRNRFFRRQKSEKVANTGTFPFSYMRDIGYKVASSKHREFHFALFFEGMIILEFCLRAQREQLKCVLGQHYHGIKLFASATLIAIFVLADLSKIILTFFLPFPVTSLQTFLQNNQNYVFFSVLARLTLQLLQKLFQHFSLILTTKFE